MLLLIKDKLKLSSSSTTMKAILIIHSTHLACKKRINKTLKNNSNKIYFKLLEKLTKTYYKLMFIQSNSTTPMLAEFILDQKKLVKASLLTMSQKEKSYADFIETTIELTSTLTLILKHSKKLSKLKEKPVKLLKELKMLNKIWKNLKRQIQLLIKCH